MTRAVRAKRVATSKGRHARGSAIPRARDGHPLRRSMHRSHRGCRPLAVMSHFLFNFLDALSARGFCEKCLLLRSRRGQSRLCSHCGGRVRERRGEAREVGETLHFIFRRACVYIWNVRAAAAEEKVQPPDEKSKTEKGGRARNSFLVVTFSAHAPEDLKASGKRLRLFERKNQSNLDPTR